MSVVGLDVGNENCIVGVARKRGIDVVLNDESKRETPAMVSFGDKQRFLGTAAAATATMNPRNTVSQIKRLIGRKFWDPEVQQDLHLFPFSVSEGPGGVPLITVTYLNEQRCFSPTQILGMIFSNLKSIAEKNLGTSVVDCVIGIPAYFTDIQRRAYLDAATIAGLHPLRLMHETTATALSYGIYKLDLAEDHPFNVAFVHVGNASMHVCVAAFKRGQLRILGQSFDRNLGGRDFDEVLFNYFTQRFKEEYKINVPSNARASQRLRIACEKLKKMLSANPEAPLNIECLMDEKDVSGRISRDEFEQLAEPILERVKIPCERALAESGLTLGQIDAVEVVGSGTRVPAVLRIIASFFRKEPSHTLNASECIARGCTLQCAMLSPTFRVRKFKVEDSFLFPISLSWTGNDPQSQCTDGLPSRSAVFVKGNEIPSTKLLTFQKLRIITIDAFYEDSKELPPGTNPKIVSYKVGPVNSKAEGGKLKVKMQLNLHGILSLEHATLIEDDGDMSKTKMKETAWDFNEVYIQDVNKDPEKMWNAEHGHESIMSEDVDNSRQSADQDLDPGGENMDLGNKNNQMDSKPKKLEVAKHPKEKIVEVPVEEIVMGIMASQDIQMAVKRESDMALQDRIMEETKEKKNAVEAYVYDMRTKLLEELHEFATEDEQEQFSSKLQQTEFWLYEDGEDETIDVYVAKLSELKKLGDVMMNRHKEDESQKLAIKEFLQDLKSFCEAAQSTDSNYTHISAGDKEKVIQECRKADDWLKLKKEQQDGLSRVAPPVLLAADVKKKHAFLVRFCKPIITKLKPMSPSSITAEASGQKGSSSNFVPPDINDAPPSRYKETDSLPHSNKGDAKQTR